MQTVYDSNFVVTNEANATEMQVKASMEAMVARALPAIYDILAKHPFATTISITAVTHDDMMDGNLVAFDLPVRER
jgi:hypothetical protein